MVEYLQRRVKTQKTIFHISCLRVGVLNMIFFLFVRVFCVRYPVRVKSTLAELFLAATREMEDLPTGKGDETPPGRGVQGPRPMRAEGTAG
jgi:hypothetical protein